MAAPKYNENSNHVRNDPHMCKIKLEKFEKVHLISCGPMELLRQVPPS